MNVGFIGLGQMGRAIAANVLRAGHTLIVWNRSEAPARELGSLGAEVAAAAADTARADVLMSMLADDDAVRAALIGQGVRPEVAREAKLNIVVAGEPDAVTRVQALLQAIGQRIWPVGAEPERANVVKLAGNFMIASALETMGEAAALARGYGIEPARFLEILTSTLFACVVYQGYGRLIGERRFEPASFALRLGLKDVRLALQAGEAAHVSLPTASIVRDSLLEAVARGESDLDWAAVASIPMRRAGLER